MTEKLFKGKNREGPQFTFLEQQFWTYAYGVIVNLAMHFTTNPGYGFGSLVSEFASREM